MTHYQAVPVLYHTAPETQRVTCPAMLEDAKSIISIFIHAKLGPMTGKKILVDAFGYRMLHELTISVERTREELLKLYQITGQELYMTHELRYSKEDRSKLDNLVLMGKTSAEREYLATTGYDFFIKVPLNKELFETIQAPIRIEATFTPLKELVSTDDDRVDGKINAEFIVERFMTGNLTKSANKAGTRE